MTSLLTDAQASKHAVVSERMHDRVHADFVQLFLSYWKGSLIALAFIVLAVTYAGHVNAPNHAWTSWGILALAACCSQAVICAAMERSSSLEVAIRRGLPWLLCSISLSGAVWGLLPWMFDDAPLSARLLACLFVVMLLFCIANSPGTPAMTIVAAPPVGLLGSAAFFHDQLYVAGGGFLLLVTIIAFYGLRLRTALAAGLAQRHLAEDLATELRKYQSRLLQLERERTLAAERDRLTRDMHDGLGSALVAALGAVTLGDIDRDHLTVVLSDCLSDLRSVLDSLEPVDGDLMALLAMSRARSERLLKGVGARLVWKMDDLPKLDWLGPSEALNVLRIMQELLNNVAKHSHARYVLISAESAGGVVELRVEDDGCGFDTAQVTAGRGRAFMRHRAHAIDSELQIESGPGHGTAVTLRLPVTR